MPKRNRGGKRSGSGQTTVPPPTTPNQPPQQPPRGRGIGQFGGFSNLAELAQAVQQNNQQIAQSAQQGDYDGNGNAKLKKWQQQADDDKAASYLAKLSKSDDVIQNTNTGSEPWGFYSNPMQKMILDMGLNAKPTVLSKSDFDNLAASTGAEVMYRGWSSADSKRRFTESDFTHIGTGRYGDGLYFGSASTASGYGSHTSRVMLSPTARVIDVNTLQSMMPGYGKLAAALRYSGTTGQRSYSNDVGGEAQWALKHGYNVIDAGWCKCVLTRDALIVRGNR